MLDSEGYLAIIEWGWVGCEELCRSRRLLLSSEAEHPLLSA